MSCCGRRRALLTAATAQARLHAPLPPPPSAPIPTATRAEPALRYLGAAPLSLRGPRSGRVYRMAHRDERIDVAAADVAALLATRLFAQA